MHRLTDRRLSWSVLMLIVLAEIAGAVWLVVGT